MFFIILFAFRAVLGAEFIFITAAEDGGLSNILVMLKA
jgi:hypothetical protein